MKAFLFLVAPLRIHFNLGVAAKVLCTVIALAWALQARAAIIPFDLAGRAGSGLLSGNEIHTINGVPGSGGELGTGILFNDSTLVLSIHVGWGSANGFVNLTGNTTLGHLHGPTASSSPAAFNEPGNVKYTLHTLPEWNSSASAGGFNGSINILPGDVSALLNGRFYFNAHTELNGAGEIRGQLVVVPEPSTWALLALGAGSLLCWKRRRKN